MYVQGPASSLPRLYL